MRLIKQEDFAILFMSELARNYGKKRMSLAEVAATHGVSVLFLKKIVRMLRQAGLVISKEGSSGGYILSRTPQEVHVWDIIRAASGKQNAQSTSKIPCPLYTRCLPQRIHKIIEDALEKSLSTISLKQLTS